MVSLALVSKVILSKAVNYEQTGNFNNTMTLFCMYYLTSEANIIIM